MSQVNETALEVFTHLGFTTHYNAPDGKEIGMFNIDEYEGVSVFIDTVSETYTISSNNLKYFGQMYFPAMSINRPLSEIVKMLDTMKHYRDLVENNKPW